MLALPLPIKNHVSLSTAPKLPMHHIPIMLQVIHIVGIPLQHLTPSIQILRMVVGTADAVLIYMGQLCFNPGRVIALLMQDGAHSVAETVASQPPLVTQQFDDLVHAFLADWLTLIVSSNENQGIAASNWLERAEQLDNLR